MMKSHYQIIRRPVITEKGLAVKENQGTLVFQVAPGATKTEIKEAVQAIFKVKVDSVRTANFPGKERRRGRFAIRSVRRTRPRLRSNPCHIGCPAADARSAQPDTPGADSPRANR